MSCFLCNSNYHFSPNCDIYETNESRQNILTSKNCCYLCLGIKDKNHTAYVCNLKKKCYNCFTKNHDSTFCSDIYPNFFIPNIDADLLPRFLQLLGHMERYHFALSNPKALTFYNLKPLKVVDRYHVDENEAKKIYAYLDSRPINLFNSKSENIVAKEIELKNSRMSFADFICLLSLKTEKLKCRNLTFTTKVAFSDIIPLIPNIHCIEFYSTNIEMTKFWPEVLLKHKKENSIKLLKIHKLKDLDFSVKALSDFMKKQSTIHICITYNQDSLIFKNFYNYRNPVIEKLSGYFIPVKTADIWTLPCLSINVESKDLHHYCHLAAFTLKNNQFKIDVQEHQSYIGDLIKSVQKIFQ